MSFLGRRKSHRPFTDSANYEPDRDDASHSHEQLFKPTQTASIKSTSTFRHRLSNLSVFAPKRKRSQQGLLKKAGAGGIGYTASYRLPESFPSRSPSPEPSLEIRRPSGLGRRASITGQSTELCADEDQSYAFRPAYALPTRKKSVSTPDLSLPFVPEGFVRWAELSETEDTTEDEHQHELECLFTRIPPDLLKTVFAFVSPPDLASVARVCKSFVPAVQLLLYRDVDLLPVTDPQCVQACIHVLASRRDLASLTRRFACNIVPDSRSTDKSTPISTVTFAIALSNMTSLASLVLPHFDPPSFFHTTFQLRSLSLSWMTATAEELQTMFAWLTGQPALTSLSFPNLILDAHTSHMFSAAALPQPLEESGLSLPPPTRLLPRLNHIHGPSCMVSALAPGRPLSSIIIHLHSTIYDGLRPSALMAEVARATIPVTHLTVVTTSRYRVDARTLERVLMAAGAELGTSLKSLEVETTVEDEVLFKQLHGILPRYQVMHSLSLRRSSASPYLTPPPTPSSASPLTPTTPSAMTPIRTRANTALPTRTQERALLGQWSKHCCTLRNVSFPSGGQWRITEGIGGAIYTFLGGIPAMRS